MLTLKIEYIPIHEIKPYENNAKIHTPEQIEQIKKSISEFGMNDPIAIWSAENVIIEGHGRLMACQEMKFETIPVIRLDDLTDEQRRAYTLIHNQTTMSTGFDLDLLEMELSNIKDIDMEAFDFDIDFEAFDLDETAEEAEDFEMELPEEPKAKPGDIYQLGRHRLMCGDSTKAEDIDRLCEGEAMDLCVTDPPYNVSVGIEDIEEAKRRKRRTDGLTIERAAARYPSPNPRRYHADHGDSRRQTAQKRHSPDNETGQAHLDISRELVEKGRKCDRFLRRLGFNAHRVRATWPEMLHNRARSEVCGRDNQPMGAINGGESNENKLKGRLWTMKL